MLVEQVIREIYFIFMLKFFDDGHGQDRIQRDLIHGRQWIDGGDFDVAIRRNLSYDVLFYFMHCGDSIEVSIHMSSLTLVSDERKEKGIRLFLPLEVFGRHAGGKNRISPGVIPNSLFRALVM